MTYIVTDNCIKCKYGDCIEVCPVDCFHEGENMVVIDPEVCIDCGVCVDECPANAIEPDTIEGAEPWVALNGKYAKLWPNITHNFPALPDAAAWDGVPHKRQQHFSENPGSHAESPD